MQLQCTVLTMLSIGVNLLRGTPKFPSVIGLSTCSPLSWSVLGVFIVICIATTIFNIRSIRKETALKEKFVCLHESEKWVVNGNLPILIALALLSSFIG